jgi:hypothetical protein
MNICPVVPEFYADGRTDRNDKTSSRLLQFYENKPKTYKLNTILTSFCVVDMLLQLLF